MNDFSLKKYNFRLVIWVIALNIIGIMVINSATGGDSSRVIRQILGICIGIVIAGIISFVPYDQILKLSYIIYLGCVFLLILVLVIGLASGVARRWVELPVIGQIQPSEFTKIGIIVFFARFIGKNEDKINSGEVILRILLYSFIPLLLVFLEPDLSTSIIIAVTILSVVFVGGISYRNLLIAAAIVIPLTLCVLFLIKRGSFPFISEYQANRILAFIDTSGSYNDQQLQQKNSVMAIASGGFLGKGLNNNSLSSIKNGNFLSAEQTDFIFAVVGEELGFAGCFVLILLYGLIIFECFQMARKAEDIQGRVICAGVGSLIAFQSFTNIAVATGVFPNTGLPLPFVSYGLSSLLSFYMGIGLVLSVGFSGDKPIARRFR